ncbi:hypothetical protein AAG906_029794 [Vitis piasezkii]
MPLSQALRKLIEAGHETDRCTALRHAIRDLIDRGLVHLGRSSVTQNPLPAHSTHAVPPPDGGIHFLDFADSDDHVCMMSWDDIDPEPIELGDIYGMSSMSLGPQVPTPFRLFPETASVHASIVEPPTSTRYSIQTPFVLVPDVEEFQAPHSDDPQTPDVQYILRGGRVLRQPPPAARPLGGTSSQEEVRAEDDEILRQCEHSGSYFYLEPLPSSKGSDHTSSLYICWLFRSSSSIYPSRQWLGLNVCPLATAIALGYAPSDFSPSVLRIPTSFNSLLGRPWIHRAEPFLLHFIESEPVLQISHSNDDFLLTGFTFDEADS